MTVLIFTIYGGVSKIMVKLVVCEFLHFVERNRDKREKGATEMELDPCLMWFLNKSYVSYNRKFLLPHHLERERQSINFKPHFRTDIHKINRKSKKTQNKTKKEKNSNNPRLDNELVTFESKRIVISFK